MNCASEANVDRAAQMDARMRGIEQRLRIAEHRLTHIQARVHRRHSRHHGRANEAWLRCPHRMCVVARQAMKMWAE